MSDNNLRLKNKVKVVPRITVLSTTLKAFLKAFGASKDCLESVDKGVNERQIIETIYLYYYSKNELCGKITLHIDWEEHHVQVNSDSGKEFNIKEGESLIEQLDKASKIIVNHVTKMKSELSVDCVVERYTYRDYYTSDTIRYDEAREYLGHKLAHSISESSTAQFMTAIRFIMDKLKELEIIVES